MTPRIQFRINESEYEALLQEAEKQGFPDVTSYVKDLVLATIAKSSISKPSVSFIDLYKEAVSTINSLEPGSEFVLRDIISNPPALLGRYIFEAVENGNIKNVSFEGKDGLGAIKYKKH
ncbi:hypothetical protein ABEO75_18355 [Paenibacillus macerans]|uniref:hypothetical protein n=1 Tax=Paenibacillus macerans TaxID=44252 RepID=UPI0024328E52|nr:hypothetical protein [Paenibacillus macerans]MBS5909141.1 hypothetical protein [Paenibacillus macerans]MDU5946460.1 hypothetical protein [Paenibacillus macerans]MED4956399.1 hypothetical protein [Paenibacillus macerans]